MFDRVKKMFRRKGELPEGVVLVDDAMRQLADAIATKVMMEAVLGGLDDDNKNWTRDERATVMGYIDGQVSVMYPIGDQKMPLASFLTSSYVLKGARSAEQVMEDREFFVESGDPVFMTAAQVGFEDCRRLMTEQRAGHVPLGLSRLLRGE